MRGLLCSPPFVRFICVRMWGHGVLPAALPAPFSTSLSPALLGYLCTNVGPQGATRRSACPILCHSESGPLGLSVRECAAAGFAFVPHSTSLGPSRATRVLSTPVPVSALLPVWMYVSFLSPWCRTSLPSIFCQFWLCEEVQCVHLLRHLGSRLPHSNNEKN